MKVIVTGGAGFIGSHTVVALLKHDYQPIIIDDFSNSDSRVIERLETLTGQKIIHHELDYTNTEALRDIIKEEGARAIIHFAAFKQVGESVNSPLQYYQNNVSGLVGLLKLAEELGIKNFVFSSSCTVYGEPDSLPVTEMTPLKPATSPYGATKQMGEIILHDACVASKTFNAVALRYFNPIGADPSALIGELPSGVPANLVPYITQTAAGIREKLLIYGTDYSTDDGSCVRDYIHVSDLAEAHVTALDWLRDQPAKAFDTFNIGTGRGASVLEVIKTFEATTGVKLNYAVGPRRPGDIVSTYADPAKAEAVLGWKAEKDLTTALSDAWRWQQTLD